MCLFETSHTELLPYIGTTRKTSTDDVFQHHRDVNCDVVYKHQYVVQHQTRLRFNLMFTNNSDVSNVDRPLDVREYYGFVKIR